MNDLIKMPNFTQEQISQFHRDGFLIFNNLIDMELVKIARSHFEPLFNGVFPTGIIPDKPKWQHQGPVNAEGIPRSICNMWKSDPTIAAITLSEEIGKACATLMGWPGVRINQDHMIYLPPGAGTIGHHQDDSYQDWNEPENIITCWISLDDTSGLSGPIEYVPGSNKWPLADRIDQFAAPPDYRKELDIEAKKLGHEIDIVHVEVPAGGGSFHHGLTWHGSNYNRTSEPARRIISHLMSSESRFHPTITSPAFNRYKHFGDERMDESFFPILWTEDGRRSKFLDTYLTTQLESSHNVDYFDY